MLMNMSGITLRNDTNLILWLGPLPVKLELIFSNYYQYHRTHG